MINTHSNERMLSAVNTAMLVPDVHHQALIAEWQQWAREATLTEKRTDAVEALIRCLQANSKVLSLSNLRLVSLPDHLPPFIERLHVSNNQLSTLPCPLPVSLKLLNAQNNALRSLPLLPASLEQLNVGYNELEQLPPLPISLQEFDVNNNRLEQLPALPASLQFLDASDNSLEQLPELPARLKNLYVINNSLERLPALPEGLLLLNVSRNALQVLTEELPAGLMYLNVSDNQFRRRPDLPPSLLRINIGNNPFEQLPPRLSTDNAILSIVSVFTDNVQFWKQIDQEACVYNFRVFLEKLRVGYKNRYSLALRQRVGEWLDYLAKEENKALRANTFLIAQEASTSCVDRASFYFNKMYLLMREDQLIKTDTPVVELFNTNLALFRLQQLEKIAAQKTEARKAVSRGFMGDIEIYLAYECLLSEELSLPIYSELHFSEIAGLTQDDLTRAKNEIEQQEKAGFIGYLINESASWQARLTQWDRLQVESVEEAYLDFIGSDDFNQQVNEQLVKDKIDIHDADAHRERAKSLAESVLYQQRYQLTREFLAAQGELALLDGFDRQYKHKEGATV